MIGYFPKVSAASLFHWGTMNSENVSKKTSSYEGNNLSLSVCPEKWAKLLNLKPSDKLFSFSKEKSEFISILPLMKSERYAETRFKLLELAVDEGLLKKELIYRVEFEDAETEELCFMTFSGYAEALNECESEDQIKDEFCYVGTPELCEALGISEENVRLSGEEYAFIELIKRHTDVDGIYWAYNDNINALSLPLYCIFPSKVSEWSYKEVK